MTAQLTFDPLHFGIPDYKWFYIVDGIARGPFNGSEMWTAIQQHIVEPDTRVRYNDMSAAPRAIKHRELRRAFIRLDWSHGPNATLSVESQHLPIGNKYRWYADASQSSLTTLPPAETAQIPRVTLKRQLGTWAISLEYSGRAVRRSFEEESFEEMIELAEDSLQTLTAGNAHVGIEDDLALLDGGVPLVGGSLSTHIPDVLGVNVAVDDYIRRNR